MAVQAHTTRRALFGGALAVSAAAALPAPVTKSAPRMSPEWAKFIDGIADLHPNGRAAATLAYEFRSKIKLEAFSGFTLDGPGPQDQYPILMFGDFGVGAITVNPREAFEGKPIPRGWGSHLATPGSFGRYESFV